MPTVEERLASLEAKVEGIADLRREMDGRFTDMNLRITELRDDMNRRIGSLETHVGSLEGKVDRHFVWLTGIMLTGFITVIGALIQLMNQ